jgi:hypothetical protein
MLMTVDSQKRAGGAAAVFHRPYRPGPVPA